MIAIWRSLRNADNCSGRVAAAFAQRSPIESTMDRYQAPIGPPLQVRGFVAQQPEPAIGATILLSVSTMPRLRLNVAEPRFRRVLTPDDATFSWID
jgi:hypothetical protein